MGYDVPRLVQEGFGMSAPTIQFFTNAAQGAFLGDAVVSLPYAGLSFTVRITERSSDGKRFVSWPQSNARFWVSGMTPEDTRRWSAWILERFNAWEALAMGELARQRRSVA